MWAARYEPSFLMSGLTRLVICCRYCDIGSLSFRARDLRRLARIKADFSRDGRRLPPQGEALAAMANTVTIDGERPDPRESSKTPSLELPGR
jgi:hypothetical protein